ncbi:hypothetical protein PG999_009300 [Apiospora kogelbergensis]|uniref:Uncharacterized protein n=1 Tax=Apiospora kogelbergensis TaxID=1337665 RepID=A0AAW0QL57_9PEZI
MGFQQPFLYDMDARDSRFPIKEFDPKAITRQSWEVKPKPVKQDGPLVSFNRHPDAHGVPTSRGPIRPMGATAKWWIKFTRKVQIGLRVLEMIAGVGLLGMMILLTNVDPITSWVLRITVSRINKSMLLLLLLTSRQPGVVAMFCVYAIYHLSQAPGARPPASSAAYQLFSAFTDLAVLPLYTFGGMAVVNHGTEWANLIGKDELSGYFVAAAYYTLIVSGGLHVVSLSISLWLGLMFRRISNMPPDMNPLEDHLTARHKRNKSSIATSYMSENAKRLSTPLEDHRRSGAPYANDLSRPPSIPFMHTRSNSQDSMASMKRDSYVDLPSRQYQIVPGNSPRNSVASAGDPRRLSKPPGPSHRGSYTEIPLQDTSANRMSRPESDAPESPSDFNPSPTRPARFTEAWYASESLINRTQERARKEREASKNASKAGAYEAVNQRYNLADSDAEDSDQENAGNRMMRPDPMDVSDFEDDMMNGNSMHPNPLRCNPTPLHRGSALTEIPLNSRIVSGSQDITEQQQQPKGGLTVPGTWQGRNRDSSIQPEEGMFYAKAYGDLKAATPPLMVGNPRQVSSGNDYDLGAAGGGKYRRNVSGKMAEEGRAGNKGYSRYSILNDD